MDVAALVAAHWWLEVASLEPIPIGINSRTWRCRSTGGDQWVVKLASNASFVAGLHLAEHLAALGLRTGPPLRTREGAVVAGLPEGHLAVLRHEAGRPGRLPGDATTIGAFLARAHRAQEQVLQLDAPTWQDHDHRSGTFVNLAHGLPELAQTVMDEAREAATHLRVGLVHGGADASEFLLSEGSTALVDWGSVERAPLLLDVAILEVLGHASTAEIAAVIDGYASIRPEVVAELDAYPSLVRCAWLRQVAFWGERYLAHGSPPGTDDADWYGFQRSLDILRTGVWRA